MYNLHYVFIFYIFVQLYENSQESEFEVPCLHF